MSVVEETPARTRRSFADEFKRDAVAMVLDDGNRIVDVAGRLGIGEGTLGNWVRQARIDRGTRRVDHQRARRVGRAAPGERPVADGTGSAQTSDGLLGEGVGTVTRYRWVAARKAEGFPITMACRVAEVSRQAFGDWRARQAAGPSSAEVAEAALVAEIREIHDESDGTYGEPRITPAGCTPSSKSTRGSSRARPCPTTCSSRWGTPSEAPHSPLDASVG
jgi:transposase-like protein